MFISCFDDFKWRQVDEQERLGRALSFLGLNVEERACYPLILSGHCVALCTGLYCQSNGYLSTAIGGTIRPPGKRNGLVRILRQNFICL